MLQLRLGFRGISGVVGLCVIGCSSSGGSSVTQRPIGSSEATTTTTARIDQMLTGLSDSTSSLDTTNSTSVATDGLVVATGTNRCSGSSSNSVVTTSSNSVDSVPKSTTDSLGNAIRRIRDEAKSHVFRQDLVESEDGNQVIYKVDPAQACNSNSECIDKLTANPVRFAVTANTDNSLNIALLVGQDRHSPATAYLSDTKLSVRGDLTQFMDSIRLYMTTDQQKNLPEKLAGVTEWSIEKRGEGDFVISSAIIEQFTLITGQAKGKPVSVTVQPSNPTSQVTINSVTNTIGFQENLGTIDVSVAGAAVCGSLKCGTKEQSGTFGLHLAGATGEFATTANATDITFSNLGLGAESSYLASNGQHLTTVDVNPNAGRKFSMNFKKTTEGTLVTFDPALDLQVAMAMSNLSDSMRVDMPEWLASEVFDVTLGGAPKPSVLVPAATCDANGNSQPKDQLQVVSGSLELKSTSIPNPVDVAAGMCLLPVSSSASKPNPFTLVKAGVCQ